PRGMCSTRVSDSDQRPSSRSNQTAWLLPSGYCHWRPASLHFSPSKRDTPLSVPTTTMPVLDSAMSSAPDPPASSQVLHLPSRNRPTTPLYQTIQSPPSREATMRRIARLLSVVSGGTNRTNRIPSKRKRPAPPSQRYPSLVCASARV